MNARTRSRLEMARRLKARVDSGSTIHVGGNTYSLPSRLIGEQVDVHVGAETLDYEQVDVPAELREMTGGRGPDEDGPVGGEVDLARVPGPFALVAEQPGGRPVAPPGRYGTGRSGRAGARRLAGPG